MKNTADGLSGQAILLVDDDTDFQNELRRMLLANGLTEVVTAVNGVAALERLDRGGIALILLDMVMPGLSGAELLGLINECYPTVPVIMITAVGDLTSIISCIKMGAFDYLTKPLDTGRLYASVSKALKFSELYSQNRQLRNYLQGESLSRPEIFSEILTVNNRMRSIFKLIETISLTPHPVLISGDTGVGKEMLAKAVHKASGLEGEFVPVNVAGLDDLMFSDTIFGHKKGAFTGAAEGRDGLIKKAQGGTLFLDEIGDLSAESQKSLLRLLQEKEYYRLGSDILYHSDARIVAASNRDLKAMIKAGTFRNDLYHRIATHEILIPPLNERRDDIPLLALHFARLAAESLGKDTPSILPEVRMALLEEDYPGNIRELKNRISNAVACNSSGVLTMEDFPELKNLPPPGRGIVRITGEEDFTLHAVFDTFPTMEEMERLFVQEALKVCDGNKAVAAELLGISRPTLNRKLAEKE